MKKLFKEYKLSKIEFIKFQLHGIINHSIPILNATELLTLAYIHVYNVDAPQKLLEDRIFTNSNSVTNYISKLTRSGYVMKETDEESKGVGKKPYSSIYLNPNIKIEEEDFIQVLSVKVDDTSQVVHHPYYRK